MSIGAELLRYNKKQKFAAPDLETESLHLGRARPYQLGMVEFTLDQDLKETNRYIWWADLNMSKGAAAITRFDYNFYKERAEDPKKVLEEFEDTIYSKSYKVVNQNYLGYDAMIINNWRRGLGLKPRNDYLHEDYKIYDTLAISRAIKKNITPDTSSGLNFLAWQYRMLSIKERLKCSLGVIAKELGAEVDENRLHDAIFDVLMVKFVFKKQIWRLELI